MEGGTKRPPAFCADHRFALCQATKSMSKRVSPFSSIGHIAGRKSAAALATGWATFLQTRWEAVSQGLIAKWCFNEETKTDVFRDGSLMAALTLTGLRLLSKMGGEVISLKKGCVWNDALVTDKPGTMWEMSWKVRRGQRKELGSGS